MPQPPLPPLPSCHSRGLGAAIHHALHEAPLPTALQALERWEGTPNGASESNELELLAPRQVLWQLLFTAGRRHEALEQARAVHGVVSRRFGATGLEAVLVGVRLGISLAACGEVTAGLRLLYDAAPVLQDTLGEMLQQAQQLSAEGQLDEQQSVRRGEGHHSLRRFPVTPLLGSQSS